MATHIGARFLAVGVLVCCSLAFCALGSAEDAAKKDAQETVVVTGRVVDTDGKPIAGATVEWGDASIRFRQRKRVKTGDDGTYELVLKSLDKSKWLAASAEEYAEMQADAALTRGPQVRDFVLRLAPKDVHVVAGEVVDEHNRPIVGAQVEARTPVVGFFSSFSSPSGGDYFPGPDRVCKTDEEGKFRIANLPEGEVQLDVQSKHRWVNDDNYPVQQGLIIKMSGSGEAGVIQGRVVDTATGLPPKNLDDVRIVPRFSTRNLKCSNEDGTFRIPGEVTLGESYSVNVYAKDYAIATAGIVAVSTDSTEFAKVELSPQPALRGKLVDAETGKPVGNAPVVYGVSEGMHYMQWSSLPKYSDGFHSLTVVQHTVTDAEGTFWVAEPKAGARGAIIVSIDGYQRLILHARNRQRDETTGEVVVRLKRESAFEGVALIDGKPAANVSVSISGDSIDGIDQMYESVRTDASGKYRYGRLRPGIYDVDCGPYSRTAKLDKGQTATVNMGDDMGTVRIHGNALPDSSVSVSPRFRWDYTQLRATSDAEGKYEIRGLRPGRYSVSIDSRYGYDLRSRDAPDIIVKNDGQEIDLLPKPPKKVAPKKPATVDTKK